MLVTGQTEPLRNHDLTCFTALPREHFLPTVTSPVVSEEGSRKRDLTVQAQLDRLRALEDGWLDGEGKAPSDEGLDWLVETFGRWYPPNLECPYFYPTEKGGVQAEWTLGCTELSVDIDLRKRSGWLYSLNLDTDDEVVRDLDLEIGSDWRVLGELIRSHDKKYDDTRYSSASTNTRKLDYPWPTEFSSVQAYT